MGGGALLTLIGTDMTYHFSVDVPLRIESIYLCALLDRPCMVFQSVCCGCDPSVHLIVPSIGFVYVFVCRK